MYLKQRRRVSKMADEINGTLYALHSNMRRLREDGPKEGQNFADAAAKINKRIAEAEQGINPAIAKASRAAAYAGKRENNSKGGLSKKDVPVIAISVGMGKMKKPKKKTAMMRGGMANGKEHMYAAGGMVNDGLKALKASGPKGLEAFNKITGK